MLFQWKTHKQDAISVYESCCCQAALHSVLILFADEDVHHTANYLHVSMSCCKIAVMSCIYAYIRYRYFISGTIEINSMKKNFNHLKYCQMSIRRLIVASATSD